MRFPFHAQQDSLFGEAELHVSTSPRLHALTPYFHIPHDNLPLQDGLATINGIAL